HQGGGRERQCGIVVGRAGGPAAERLDRLLRPIAPGGEFIELHRSRRWQLAALQDACSLQPLEPLGKDLGADAGERGAQIGKATPAEHQLPDDQERPALAYQLQGKGGTAGILVPPSMQTARLFSCVLTSEERRV